MATKRVMSAFNDAIVGSITWNDNTLAVTSVSITVVGNLSVTVTVTDGTQVFTQRLDKATTSWNVGSAQLTMVSIGGRIGVPPGWSWNFTVA